MTAIPLPHIWIPKPRKVRPWWEYIFPTAGKVGRKSTGKTERNASGKLYRRTESSDCGCCTDCADCPDLVLTIASISPVSRACGASGAGNPCNTAGPNQFTSTFDPNGDWALTLDSSDAESCVLSASASWTANNKLGGGCFSVGTDFTGGFVASVELFNDGTVTVSAVGSAITGSGTMKIIYFTSSSTWADCSASFTNQNCSPDHNTNATLIQVLSSGTAALAPA